MWNLGTCYAQQTFSDTLFVNESEFDNPVYYSARDSIFLDAKNKKVHLYGDAKVDDGEINLTAGYILIDLEGNEVMAKYAYDKDSTKVEKPVFTDGSDEIKASTIRYNFDTKKGFIEEVAIQQSENYLYMETAKRHANEEIHFKKGRFTTCDLEEPHYHFQLSRAVLVPNKRIVSGPMNLWIKGVPSPIGLPFSIIPQAEEQTRGLIFPRFVPASQFGFGFDDLGYYIPVNDRFHTTFYASLYSRGSWGIRNASEYAKRYGYRGSFNVGFQQFRAGFPTNVNTNKVTVNWTHNKDPKSSPYWGFRANVNFISDNNTQNNLDPLNSQYFSNTLQSDINLTRQFPGKPITSGMKVSLRQNSITNNITLVSPVVNVNVTRFFPFKNLVKSSRGWRQLLTSFGVTYNFEGKNQADFQDSLLRNGNLGDISDQFVNGFNQTATVQTTVGLFKNALKLTPSMNYGNRINFTQIRKSYDTGTSSMVIDTLDSPGMAHTLSLNTQATTVLYSYYRFVGKNEPLVRHVMTPSLTFSYVPNLNPIDTLYTPTDTTTYSRFERSLYPTSQTRTQTLLTFNVNNTFELKRKSAKDTVDGFKRTRIIDQLGLRGNYDFLKDSMNLSDLTLDLRISPVSFLNFVSSATFSPYNWIDSTGKTIKDYAISTRGKLGRFTRFNFTTNITLTSKESREKIKEGADQIAQVWNADLNYFMLYPERVINFNIPWKISFSHVLSLTANQNISATNPDRWTETHTLAVNGDLSFTKRWKIITALNMNLKEVDITNARFSLSRDMHCWALQFHWTPIGGNKSFLFSIRSTSSLFQDAKIDIRKPPAFL